MPSLSPPSGSRSGLVTAAKALPPSVAAASAADEPSRLFRRKRRRSSRSGFIGWIRVRNSTSPAQENNRVAIDNVLPNPIKSGPMHDAPAASSENARPDDGGGRDWSSPQRFALILAAMVFIPFWNVLLGFDTFGLRDFGVFSIPTAYFQRECFWHGELPLWNPYNCCGLPFLAQFNLLALYPLSLIYLLLPLTWALPVFCLLHLFLGGLGMYFLASRWTGSRAGGTL